MKKFTAILAVLVLCLTFAGCSPETGGSSSSKPESAASGKAEASSAVSQPVSSTESTPAPDQPAKEASSAVEAPADSQPQEEEEAPASGQATLYIGTKASGFAEYPCSLGEGELTPEALIEGIADLTGWDLTLAEPVTTGKGGMSVCLASTSSLFVGPPDPQKDEFHMYDADQMAETLLDSIQKTLQEGFTGEGGDPDNIDIYFYMEGEQPLSLPDVGVSWPLDQPYQWSHAVRE